MTNCFSMRAPYLPDQPNLRMGLVGLLTLASAAGHGFLITVTLDWMFGLTTTHNLGGWMLVIWSIASLLAAPVAAQLAHASMTGTRLWDGWRLARWPATVTHVLALLASTLLLGSLVVFPCLLWAAGLGGLFLTAVALVPTLWLGARAWVALG